MMVMSLFRVTEAGTSGFSKICFTFKSHYAWFICLFLHKLTSRGIITQHSLVTLFLFHRLLLGAVVGLHSGHVSSVWDTTPVTCSSGVRSDPSALPSLLSESLSWLWLSSSSVMALGRSASAVAGSATIGTLTGAAGTDGGAGGGTGGTGAAISGVGLHSGVSVCWKNCIPCVAKV